MIAVQSLSRGKVVETPQGRSIGDEEAEELLDVKHEARVAEETGTDLEGGEELALISTCRFSIGLPNVATAIRPRARATPSRSGDGLGLGRSF